MVAYPFAKGVDGIMTRGTEAPEEEPTHMLDVAWELTWMAWEIDQLRVATPALSDALDLQLEATIAQATAGRDVLTHRAAMELVAADPEDWYRGYRDFGVLPWGPVAWGMAEAVRRSAAAEDPEALLGAASGALDAAERLCRDARGYDQLGLILSAVHQALPLFASARELLQSARQLQESPDADTAKEIQGAEEGRMACIEVLASAGDPLVSQVMALMPIVSTEGDSVGDAINRSVKAVSSRLPFYPDRLAAHIHVAADSVTDSASSRATVWKSFDQAFVDGAFVEASTRFRARYASD